MKTVQLTANMQDAIKAMEEHGDLKMYCIINPNFPYHRYTYENVNAYFDECQELILEWTTRIGTLRALARRCLVNLDEENGICKLK